VSGLSVNTGHEGYLGHGNGSPVLPGVVGIPPDLAMPPDRTSWTELQLPPFSTVATKALQLVSANAPLRRLADLISTDPAFSTEILTLINSPLYAFSQTIHSIQQAIALLGLERIKRLVVRVGFRAYLGPGLRKPALQGCWLHSLACAMIAEELAEFSSMDRGTAYTGCVLHDIGRVALAVTQPEQYECFSEEIQEDQPAALRRERECFGVDHCEAGRRLSQEWNLPGEFADLVSRHHSKQGSRQFDMLTLIRCACMMATSVGFAAVHLYTPPTYEELVSELPEKIRSHFQLDPKYLISRIDEKISSIAFQ
jgi:putative nucleotidyltransferase with HDIG domain